MKPETRANLERVIGRVERLVAGAEAEAGAAPDWGKMDAWHRRRQGAALDAIRKLEREYRARFSYNPPDGHALALAGVRSSCTSGHFGLLHNWIKAARRRVERA